MTKVEWQEANKGTTPTASQVPRLRLFRFRVAGKTAAVVFVRAAGDADGFSVDEGVGNFSSCFVQVPPRGFAGDAEDCCCFFLGEVVKVHEFQDGNFFGKDNDRFCGGLPVRADRCVAAGCSVEFDTPPYAWPPASSFGTFGGVFLHDFSFCIVFPVT